MSNQPRFDGRRYRDCKWCGGRGCLSCPAEAEKEYKRQFPDGPKPIASFDLTKPEESEAAKKLLGEAISVFGRLEGGSQ